MRILGHGVDLVHILRITAVIERQGDNFTKRVFTDHEFEYCTKHESPEQYFAARFAAKEAFGKAMGTGIGASDYLSEVGVVHEPVGPPKLELSGKCAEAFAALGGKEIFLSIAHDGEYSMASVILYGSG